MSAPLTLVVLAAGMGSRYGGNKQLDGVGPGGATLMDYSLYDAQRAGFSKVVFIVRPEMDEVVRTQIAARHPSLRTRTAHQRITDVPAGVSTEGRAKPWGTGHALLAVADVVRGPFAVVNADDFYGAPAFSAVAAFLREPVASGPATWAVAGYRLSETVSPSGGVNRAVCRGDDWLTDIEEVIDIVPSGGGYAGRGTRGSVLLTGEELVSMNIWAFTPALFAELRDGFARFLAGADLQRAEYLLPAAVQDAVRSGAARVRVLDARSRWFGLTHAADRDAVSAAIAELVRGGQYPERFA